MLPIYHICEKCQYLQLIQYKNIINCLNRHFKIRICHTNDNIQLTGSLSYRDDTERFFEDLKKGEKISILLAPAFLANYPKEYASVLGGLKNLGVNRIVSISFGADITTWGYIKYITENKFYGGISQPCPAIVSYIEKYIPELIPRLVPVHSPMMCGAIYAKKYMKIPDKLPL